MDVEKVGFGNPIDIDEIQYFFNNLWPGLIPRSLPCELAKVASCWYLVVCCEGVHYPSAGSSCLHRRAKEWSFRREWHNKGFFRKKVETLWLLANIQLNKYTGFNQLC